MQLDVPEDAVLYEARPELAAKRRRRGLAQAELADRAGIPRPHVSRLENSRARVLLAKAERVAAALERDVDELFVRLVSLSRAAADRGLERSTLRAAVDAGAIVADRVERSDRRTRVYFVEANLDAQLEQLPACKADSCEERALAPSGYCTVHKWRASHERIRRAIAKPVDERYWLIEAEVTRLTGRAWEVVHRAIACGDLRAVRVSGCVVLAKRDVDEWDAREPRARRRRGTLATGTSSLLGEP